MPPTTRRRSKAKNTVAVPATLASGTPTPRERILQLASQISNEHRHPDHKEKVFIREFMDEHQETIKSLKTHTRVRNENTVHPVRPSHAAKAKLADARSLMKICASLRAPWRRIPDEVLMTIFLFVVEPDAEATNTTIVVPEDNEQRTLLLGQICRHWRRVALGTHRLWNHLTITVREYVCVPTERFKLWLKRSGMVPLFITLGWNQAGTRHVRAILDILQEHAPRIAGLRAKCEHQVNPGRRYAVPVPLPLPGVDGEPYAAIAALIEAVTESKLRVLGLDLPSADSARFLAQLASPAKGPGSAGLERLAIAELTTVSSSMKRSYWRVLDFKSLTTVSVTAYVELRAFLDLVDCATSLHTLHVHGRYGDQDDPASGLDAPQMVTSKSLRRLCLHDFRLERLCTFLSRLTLPILDHFAIEDPFVLPAVPDLPHITDLFTRSQCALTHLTFTNYTGDRSRPGFSSMAIMSCLVHAACRTLTALRIGNISYCDHLLEYLKYRDAAVHPNPHLTHLTLVGIGCDLGVLVGMLRSRLSLSPGAPTEHSKLGTLKLVGGPAHNAGDAALLGALAKVYPDFKLEMS